MEGLTATGRSPILVFLQGDEAHDGTRSPCRRLLLGHAGSDPPPPGVISTRVGYTGGDVPNATYRNHGTHAEAIEIIFDPHKTSYRDLLEFFFQIHDPTTRNRQGNDIGASYRSAIFYTSDEQKRVAEDTIADVDASGLWPGKVVTEVTPGGRVLGGRAGAPGLSGAHTQRLHVPLRTSELEAAAACANGKRRAGVADRTTPLLRRLGHLLDWRLSLACG